MVSLSEGKHEVKFLNGLTVTFSKDLCKEKGKKLSVYTVTIQDNKFGVESNEVTELGYRLIIEKVNLALLDGVYLSYFELKDLLELFDWRG